MVVSRAALRLSLLACAMAAGITAPALSQGISYKSGIQFTIPADSTTTATLPLTTADRAQEFRVGLVPGTLSMRLYRLSGERELPLAMTKGSASGLTFSGNGGGLVIKQTNADTAVAEFQAAKEGKGQILAVVEFRSDDKGTTSSLLREKSGFSVSSTSSTLVLQAFGAEVWRSIRPASSRLVIPLNPGEKARVSISRSQQAEATVIGKVLAYVDRWLRKEEDFG